MDFSLPESVDGIRTAVRELCARFPGEYWRGLEPDRYPDEFVAAARPFLRAALPNLRGADVPTATNRPADGSTS